MKKLILLATALCMMAGCTTQKSATTDTKDITGKRWKLVELNGKPIEKTRAFISLTADGTVSGNWGCNTFNGVYTQQAEVSRIKFDKLAGTLKMCLDDMETEDALKRVLDTADNYSLSENGKTLSLNRARMAPLARFEVEYLK